MKSPNVYTTSLARASLRRTFCAFALATWVCSLACGACSSTNSELSSRGSVKNPYAKYDPKTPEEEAYYRDVYSGNWKEDSTAGVPSICKQSASTRMPEHWNMLPPGAKTLSEIRTEASQRKLAAAMSYRPDAQSQASFGAAPSFGGYQSVPTQSAYASQAQAPAQSATTYDVPAPPQASVAPSAYSSQAPATPSAYAPQASVAPSAYVSQAPATPSAYAPQASVAPSAYVSQAPATPSACAPQTSVAPSAYVSQAPAASSAYAPQTSVAPSAYAPQSVAPSGASYQGASVDLFASRNWIVRGQAPEDDPFADDSDDENDPFADDKETADDSDDEDDPFAGDEETDEETTDEEGAEEIKEAESVETGEVEESSEVESQSVKTDAESKTAEVKSQPVKPVVEMKEENVVVKNVASNAVVLPSGKPGSVQVQPVVVDPSIAAPFVGVKRPVNSAPESNAKRGEQEEYVVSGGDSKGDFYSRKDWSYENLDPEDSVAHFDTVDGRILAEPSNKLFIYSPRFGAVRQTLGPVEGDSRLALETAIATDEPTLGEAVAGVDVRTQEVKPLGAGAIQNVEGAEARVAPAISSGNVGVLEADSQIRLGALLTSETIDDLSSEDSSLVFDGAVAAQSWDGEQGVAVSTDLVNAFSNAYVEGASTVFAIKDDTKTSKLRVIKIANKDAAKPGEFVEFTLRFENIGDEPIGNVTILDNLSSRLRYVDGTAKSSVQADFSANLSESGSLVLRWEIKDPLEPKEFGVARFICKVW